MLPGEEGVVLTWNGGCLVSGEVKEAMKAIVRVSCLGCSRF